MTPDDRRYTREHEWVQMTDGIVRIGITDYAQEALGDIVFVTLPEPGTDVSAGGHCGEVESTKSVSEVYAPLTGTVAARNDVVETAPETINEDPYGSGWLLEIRPADPVAVDLLLSANDYEALIQEI